MIEDIFYGPHFHFTRFLQSAFGYMRNIKDNHAGYFCPLPCSDVAPHSVSIIPLIFR